MKRPQQIINHALLVMVVASLTGCAFDDTHRAKSTDLAETQAGLQDIKAKIARLQAVQETNSETARLQAVQAANSLEDVKAEMERLQAVITELSARVVHLEETTEKLNGVQKVALLRPGIQDYSQIQLDLGALIVQIANVKPHPYGSQIVIKFGNPLSASINGLSGTVEWGETDEGGVP